MVVESGRETKRLRRALLRSRSELEVFRTKRMEALREYIGGQYSDDGAEDKVPVNFLRLAVLTYLRHLASATPLALVTTEHKQLKPEANDLGLALTRLMRKIAFGDSLRRIVLDSLFTVGVSKVGLGSKNDARIEDSSHHNGMVFCDPIDFDDWCHDTSARRWEEMQFRAHRARRRLVDVQASALYDPALTKDLKPLARQTTNNEGDERPATLAGEPVDSDELDAFVELWEVYLPREQRIVTFADEECGVDGALREEEWAGLEEGPFRRLKYEDVPGSAIPLSPVSMWKDLSDLGTVLFRKLGRQAERQKTFGLVRRGSDADGNRVVNVSDGEVIACDDPKSFNEGTAGGPNQTNLAFFLMVKDLFSWQAGNLDSLAGLSAQAETLGQEELLKSSSSELMNQMKVMVTDYVVDVLRDMAWWLISNPLVDIPLTKPIPGTDSSIQGTFSPRDMSGDFLDYNFAIEPFSLQHQPPAKKLGLISQFFSNFIMPMAPQLAQEGISVNFTEFFRLYGKYASLPELNDLLTFSSPSQEMLRGPIGEHPKAAQTTRRYERVSRPGATGSGKDQVMMQALLGKRSQPSEMAAVGRPSS